MLGIGTKAPDFTLLDQNGEEHTLSEYRGSYVLLYFYPKDDTPGCTREACMIRDAYDDFEELGIIVMGVSKDSVKSHKKFEEKYDLPFVLLADTQKVVLDLYEALSGERTQRVSYLINPEGEIIHVYPKVDPATHAQEILEKVRDLVS